MGVSCVVKLTKINQFFVTVVIYTSYWSDMNYEEERFQALTEEFNKKCETFSYLKAEYEKLKREHLLVKRALQYDVTMPQLFINTFVPTRI